MPAEDRPSTFTSDVEPDVLSSGFGTFRGNVRSFDFPLTDIAPEEARGYSMEQALEVYRHFCEILTRCYGKPKRRKNRDGYYESLYLTERGVGISPGGCRSFVECYVQSPEEMFIEGEYARLVAKGYISEDE